MVRKRIFLLVASMGLPVAAVAQAAPQEPEERMMCAAAALALHDLLASPEEKPHYLKQADDFVQPIADAATDQAAEDRLVAEFSALLLRYRERIETMGEAAYLVQAYEEYEKCGGTHPQA